MVSSKILTRNTLIPVMLFLGACCCDREVIVDSVPRPPASSPQPVVSLPPVALPAPPPPPLAFVGPVLGDVFYDFDKSFIRNDAVEQLKTNAAWLQENGTRNIIIEGHCDERGTNEYNLALGLRRANRAKEYLVKLGIKPKRMKPVTYGEERPFDDGHNEKAWKQNRRAHFVPE
ncbi:MAG: peptidoglycan-associated lipoprotein Pal [Chlorobiaceae bacterium]